MSTIRYALIGYGKVAQIHAKALKDAKDSTLVAVWGRDSLKAQAFAREFGILAYTDIKLMVKEAKVDAVIITTPHPLHKEHTIAALRAGAHVLVEKPMALTVGDCDAMIETAKVEKKLLSVISQRRWFPASMRIHKAIEDGKLGTPMLGQVTMLGWRDEEYYKSDPWRGSWSLEGGGVLINQAPHQLDLLHWFLGPVKEVYAQWDNINHPYIEAEDLGLALVKFTNGSYGLIEGTTNIYPQNLEETLYLFGEKGTVKAGGQSVNIIEEWRFADMLDDAEEVKATYHENPPNVYGFGHTPLFADVIEAIRTDRQPKVTAEDGKRALELVLAIYKSAAEGRPVKLPLDKCATTDFTGRFS